MKQNKFILLLFFLICASSVNAFFETPSNNIIVSNNLYNGSFNLSSLNLDNLTVNGQLNLKENQISIYENGDNWTYSETGAVTGNMRIVFPHNSINFTAIIDVEGYDSAKANFWEGTIYATYNEVNSFTTGLCDAKISGETPFTSIIFKYNAPNPTIDLGYSSTSNSNPFWRIKKITFVGENSDLDWSSVYVKKNTVVGFGGIMLTGNTFKVWSNDNDGVGSGLDADYFGGNVYTRYWYGNGDSGTFQSSITDFNNASRIGYYTGNNLGNLPFPSGSNKWNGVLNLNLQNGVTAFNNQIGFSIDSNKMAIRREYGEGVWSSWSNILTDDYTGNVDIDGIVTSNSFYTTNGAFETFLNPDYMGIGTTDTTAYPNSMWFYNINGTLNGYSIGEGRDGKLRLVVGYDYVDGSFIRNDFVMDENGNIEMGNNVTIGGNLNVTGDIYNKNYYAEGYYYNSTGGGTPYTITVSATNTSYNLTNWIAGEYNGFTFENNGITANHTGIYQLSGSITFTGGNDEYAFTMAINGIPIPKCGMGLTASSSTRDNVALTCLISLDEGEHLNLQVMDKNNPPTDVNIYKTDLNIIKISD